MCHLLGTEIRKACYIRAGEASCQLNNSNTMLLPGDTICPLLVLHGIAGSMNCYTIMFELKLYTKIFFIESYFIRQSPTETNGSNKEVQMTSLPANPWNHYFLMGLDRNPPKNEPVCNKTCMAVFVGLGDPGEVSKTGPGRGLGWAGQWAIRGQLHRLWWWRWMSSLRRWSRKYL